MTIQATRIQLAPALFQGIDASDPPAELPDYTVDIVAGYVGETTLPGPPDTPHIWSADQWNALEADGRARGHPVGLLPIYTHNYPGDPQADARNAVNACLALGWAANMPGSQRRIIALDLETFVDKSYVGALEDAIYRLGFIAMPYGSNYYDLQNPPGVGWWVALPEIFPPRYLGPGVQGVQWQLGGTWDRSVFAQRVMDGCGFGPRRT